MVLARGKRLGLVAVIALSTTRLTACSGTVNPVTAPLSVSDAVNCATSTEPTPISNSRFMEWFYQQPNESAFGTDFTSGTTTRRDRLVVDFRGATRFAGGPNVTGPYTSLAFYDPVHHLAIVCTAYDKDFSAVQYISNVSPPTVPITAKNLAGITTEHGIGLGSTSKAVTIAYGAVPRWALQAAAQPRGLLIYEKWVPVGPRGGFTVSTGFAMVNGRVAGIWRGTKRADVRPDYGGDD